ncbi:MAG: hypothetical protein B6U89_00865 [Desulfurococcales archaeon ex4484_58]|nr:MAG: hypothetical protein B6U89_00865 [Desulfurococcales archaeon ex4484_58]
MVSKITNTYDLINVIKNLNTYEEISYYILCSENKYEYILPFKVVEGSDYLVYKTMYCRNLYLVLKCLSYIYAKTLTSDSIYLCR